jgi:hypothetical protein
LKYLKLTILQDNSISKAELANTFGAFEPIVTESNVFKYLQFSFENVRMLTAIQLTPVYHLLKAYEKQNGTLQFKMFHLHSDEDGSHSPISLQCLNNTWSVVSLTAGELQSSPNLLTLI